jgi:hypothetical protein
VWPIFAVAWSFHCKYRKANEDSHKKTDRINSTSYLHPINASNKISEAGTHTKPVSSVALIMTTNQNLELYTNVHQQVSSEDHQALLEQNVGPYHFLLVRNVCFKYGTRQCKVRRPWSRSFSCPDSDSYNNGTLQAFGRNPWTGNLPHSPPIYARA